MEFCSCLFFFFNDTATTEIYTLSLHDALPICQRGPAQLERRVEVGEAEGLDERGEDRKSTRLNSSHPSISYAVFCLKKKKEYGATRCNIPHRERFRVSCFLRLP